MNRREVLTGMALAGATAVTPFVGSSIGRAATADTAQWNAVHARYRAARLAYDAVCDRHDRAEEAAGDAQPRIARYFDEYQLGMSMKRDDVEYWLRRYAERTGQKIDILKTADEFTAYQRVSNNLREQHRIEQLWADVKAGQPAYFAARDGLMKAPAPHHAALLVKMEVAAESLDNEHAESVVADARRLLANGRA